MFKMVKNLFLKHVRDKLRKTNALRLLSIAKAGGSILSR